MPDPVILFPHEDTRRITRQRAGMTVDFEELDFRATTIGELSLRRRAERSLGVEVYEVKLGDEYLMSSLFTEGEIALAKLGLDAASAADLEVVVGGLGLGYTARAVLQDPAVHSLLVIEALPAVIDWHRRGLVPLGPTLTGDARCRFLEGDFFALAASPDLDPGHPGRRFDAILVDIDHSPCAVLHPSNASFYRRDGLQRLATHLNASGVFALWSNDPPDEAFGAEMAAAFAEVRVHVVRFHNPLQNREASNTVYVGRC
jgi:spermidine synthase